MRILHLIYDHADNPWVGGGGAVRAHEIYRRLADRHKITVLCGKYPGANDHNRDGISYIFTGTDQNSYMKSTFSYAWFASDMLSKLSQNVDVVVEDFAPYNPVLARWRSGRPTVIQLHHREGMNLLRRYSLLGLPFYLIELIYPKLYDHVICVSTATCRRFGVSAAAVIPNGIDKIHPGHLAAEGDYACYVGRMDIHNKGLDTLLEASHICGRKLRLAGKGKDEARIRAAIEAAGISSIQHDGWLSGADKEQLIASSRFLVLPSRSEGQGIALLEAAAFEKPSIVSDIPELKYAVEAGFALSFTTGDAEDLAQKMNRLHEDKALRELMGKKAIAYAAALTWDNVARDFEAHLARISRL